MKRLIGMVAAMALVTSSAAYGQNTLVEIHQYFTVANAASIGLPGAGGLVPSPTDFTSNPSLTVPQGSDVYLAVWVRMLQGNSAGQIALTSFNYEVGASGNVGNFSVASRRQRDPGGSYVPTAGTPTPANPATLYNDGAAGPLSPNISQFLGLSGANSGAGSAAEINSGSLGDGLGAWMLQIVQIHASSTPGDTLNLYLTTPKTGGATYATTGNAASLTTIAYGATSTGAMDQKRQSNTTADVVGTLNDRVSRFADATITVVPEPGTMGLLALGLLALRRRRA